jgi:pimeloyl-ACP methyl ester carboxylesterase
MKLARDGIQLSFDIAGAGPPEFLFVHGLGGNHTHFASDSFNVGGNAPRASLERSP